jgi:UcrQ family
MGAHGKNWWGAPMARQVGFIEYSISPYMLKPFKGFFQPGAMLFLKRSARQLAFIGPPIAFYYFLAGWGDKQVCKADVVGNDAAQGRWPVITWYLATCNANKRLFKRDGFIQMSTDIFDWNIDQSSRWRQTS